MQSLTIPTLFQSWKFDEPTWVLLNPEGSMILTPYTFTLATVSLPYLSQPPEPVEPFVQKPPRLVDAYGRRVYPGGLLLEDIKAALKAVYDINDGANFMRMKQYYGMWHCTRCGMLCSADELAGNVCRNTLACKTRRWWWLLSDPWVALAGLVTRCVP